MKFLRLEIENFRQYKDKITINFSTGNERNVNILQGKNGAGKTNLMNALTWCLYGKEENLTKYSGKRLPIMNASALREMPLNSSIETGVQIVMINPAGETTIFERKLVTKKDAEGNLQSGNPDFHAYQQKGTDLKESTLDKNFLVNRILPQSVKGFFFFDGERLDEFFKEENSSRVKAAILDVSQLSLLDKSITHLEKTISSIRGDLRYKGSIRLSEISTEINDHEKKRDKLRDDKKIKDDELIKINEEIEQIDQKLSNNSIPLIKELQKQRTSLEANYNNLQLEAKNVKKDITDYLLECGPSIYAIASLKFALDTILSISNKGDLPPKMKDTFVKELLEVGQCICGNDISHECPARQKVAGYLNEVKISQIHDDLTDLKYQINPCIKQAVNFPLTQNKLREKLSGVQTKLQETETKLKDISVRLQGVNIEEIANLEVARSRLDQNQTSCIVDIRLLEEKIKSEMSTIEKLQRELTKELEKHAKFKLLNEKLKVGNEATELLTNVKQRLIDDIRKTIEQKTRENFNNLIWKKGVFSKVEIDEDYNLSVINKFGDECTGDLSAGERQVLALSFLAALREVSGFDAPIVIDTPLGRISKEPKENIAELLPKFLKGHQVTLLATDEEYNKGVRDKLLQHVGKEYELLFNEEDSTTTVRSYESV